MRDIKIDVSTESDREAFSTSIQQALFNCGLYISWRGGRKEPKYTSMPYLLLRGYTEEDATLFFIESPVNYKGVSLIEVPGHDIILATPTELRDYLLMKCSVLRRGTLVFSMKK
jgi:hypothetical protein